MQACSDFPVNFQPRLNEPKTPSPKQANPFKTRVIERGQVDDVKSERQRSLPQGRGHRLVSAKPRVFSSGNFFKFPLICSPRGVSLGTKGDGGTAETKALPGKPGQRLLINRRGAEKTKSCSKVATCLKAATPQPFFNLELFLAPLSSFTFFSAIGKAS